MCVVGVLVVEVKRRCRGGDVERSKMAKEMGKRKGGGEDGREEEENRVGHGDHDAMYVGAGRVGAERRGGHQGSRRGGGTSG